MAQPRGESIGRIHYRFGTPFLAVLPSAVVTLGSVVVPTQSAGSVSSPFFLLSFVVVTVAVIRLRRERPEMSQPSEVPFDPIPPVLGIVLNSLLAVVLIRFLVRTDLLALLLSVGRLAAGGVMYVVRNRYRPGTRRRRTRCRTPRAPRKTTDPGRTVVGVD